ncbi:MAG: hypothetical protein J5850_00765 [Clostridia bacterium]|nr:hypothetical protein [Clostridia bacterium]
MNTLPTFKDGAESRPYLFVSERAEKQITDNNLNETFDVRYLRPYERLDTPVASHADMLIERIDDSLITYKEYYDNNPDVFCGTEDIFLLENVNPVKEYPGDIALNFLFTGKHLVGKADVISKKTSETAADKGIPVINVRQGYSRCSTLFADNCAVTSDKGISEALKSLGTDTLLIQSGNIKIDKYGYGFIGGASFVYENRVFFFGNPAYHPDGERIIEFLSLHGKETVILSDEILNDSGGATVY